MYALALVLLGAALISLPGSMTLWNDNKPIPAFVKWPPALAYPDCAPFFNGGDECDERCEAVIKQYVGDDRVTLPSADDDGSGGNDDAESCSDYFARGHYAQRPASAAEANFPIAFANIVYKDFDLLERIFSVVYAPQNFYCYAVDAKASAGFKRRLTRWAACFENVVVPDVELSVASSGVNVTAAHLSCLTALQNTNYEYAILLQNHDIPLRTNAELVRILTIFDGANDISTLKPTPSSFNPDANWTFAHLNLFRNSSRNTATIDVDGSDFAAKLYLTKSLVGVSLSRAMVDFVLDGLDVSGFVNQLEEMPYGMDENFISTLNSNDLVDAPGRFTRACLLRGFPVAAISRYAVWDNHAEDCHSQRFRHSICVFGVEDLRYLARRNQLFFNKMMPDFDYGSAMCWLESLYNRTHFATGEHYAGDEYYATLPQVRFHQQRHERAAANSSSLNLFAFNCTHPYRDYYF